MASLFASLALEIVHVGGDPLTLLWRKANLQGGVFGHQIAQRLAENLGGYRLGHTGAHGFGTGRESRLGAGHALLSDTWPRKHGAVVRLGPARWWLLVLGPCGCGQGCQARDGQQGQRCKA